ncbi:glycosyltransferase family 2 protein [Ethanoligenens sp.]|uniref:glycosyltransferase family 2 protein n=1 Tax=Ethanoligenens sp. TaxID=2099655 RepID=UPI0039E8C892
MGRLKISVIMLTYNRETLVERAIRSIQNQTFQEFEFIIIDNGSTDASGEIAEHAAAEDARIRVIHRKCGNIGSGRNAGLDAAKGDYIAFIDDDDYCEPDYLKFLLDLAVEYSTDMAICGATDKVFDEKRIMTAEEALIELMWRKKYNVAFPAKLFRATLFDGLRFSATSKYDDIELMPRIMARAQRIAYHGLPKYTFERHGGNNSAWTTNHSLLDAATLNEYLSVYRERTEWLIAHFPDNVLAWRYFEWSFMLSMLEKITRLKLRDCESQCGKIKKELREYQEKFIVCSLTQEFEKEWVKRYVCS